jgi:hypothetical protein
MRMLGGAACGGPAQAVPTAASGSGQSSGTCGACIMRRQATAMARAQPAAPVPLHRARRPATSTGAPTPTPLHRAIRASPPRPWLATSRCHLRLLHRRQRWRAWPVADRTPCGGTGCFPVAAVGVRKEDGVRELGHPFDSPFSFYMRQRLMAAVRLDRIRSPY